MEILHFDGGRMKITLTREELALYEIDLHGENDERKMKRAFDTILALAQLKTGARLSADGRTVQMYPSRDGGCEIFVHNKREELPPGLPAPQKARVGRYICRFDSEKELKGALLALRRAGEEPEAWRSKDGESGSAWYLVSCAGSRTLAFLEAFGSKCLFDPTPYMREHLSARRLEV